MYKPGTIIAVNGFLYEYVGFDEHLNRHQLSEIDIDEKGILTATYGVCYMTEYDLKISNTEIRPTKQQWYGIVECFIRQDYDDLSPEEVTNATEDIVGRCFAYGIPQIHELADYIADYMNR